MKYSCEKYSPMPNLQSESNLFSALTVTLSVQNQRLSSQTMSDQLCIEILAINGDPVQEIYLKLKLQIASAIIFALLM